jgi:hypothetical protein
MGMLGERMGTFGRAMGMFRCEGVIFDTHT